MFAMQHVGLSVVNMCATFHQVLIKKPNSSWTLYETHELFSRNRNYRNRKLTKAYSDGTTILYQYMMILFFPAAYSECATKMCPEKK